MTIRELIAELEKYDLDCEVAVNCFGSGDIEGVQEDSGIIYICVEPD